MFVEVFLKELRKKSKSSVKKGGVGGGGSYIEICIYLKF